MDEDKELKMNKYGMASTAKSIGEFGGDDGDNVDDWMESAEMIASLLRLDEKTLFRLCFLGLRGKAKSWGTTWLKENGSITWGGFKKAMVERFANKKEVDETLARFLSTSEVSSYKEFLTLLNDATTVRRARGLNTEHLMRQVIARAPAGIKSLLIQSVQNGNEFEVFLAAAEQNAWVVFPDRIINAVEINEANMIQNNVDLIKESNAGRKGKWFCYLHGYGEHSTKFCEVIRLVESKGWIRKRKGGEQFRSIKTLELNKNQDSLYTDVKKVNVVGTTNHFIVVTKIGKNIVPMLIDTGADLSIMNKKFVPKGIMKEMKTCSVRLKSASGNNIDDIVGKISNLDIKLGSENLKIDTVVTENSLPSYGILGVDAIMNNRVNIANMKETIIQKVKLNKHQLMHLRLCDNEVFW